MAKVSCEICNRNFKDEEGLAQHNAAKHSSTEEPKKLDTGKIKVWVIVIAVLVVVVGLLGWGGSMLIKDVSECRTTPAKEMNIGSHQNLALHIHSKLQIVIDGKGELIPANIGVLPGIMRPLHTHDSAGKIHIEGPCRRSFKVGEIFEVWGKTFNSGCIFDYCTDKGKLKMLVNGKENNEFENYEMRDNDNILIEYSSSN